MAKTDATLKVGFESDKASLRQMQRDLAKSSELAGISRQTVNKRFKQPLGRIRGELGEFNKSMEASNARVIAFGASTAVIAGMATALRGVAKASIDVEKSLADINVILNTTTKGLNNFGNELFKIAANTGQSFQVVADAAGELARQGLGMEQTLRRTSDALILARLSGMDTVDAVNSLTAAINSFSKSALTSTEIVNKLANVDAAFAVSSADLAEAIKRVGSSASDAGVSMDQLIAIVTTAQQTTARGGAVIGNSFKTIFTRLQRPAVLDQLNQLGVATQDAQGNIKPLISVLQGLAKNFDSLEDVQKSQVAELVGGVFQVNVLKAALSDLGQEYSVYGRALETSISSTDEAIKRNEQLNQTLSALINRTFVNLQNVGQQIGDIGFAPQASNILQTVNKQLEGVDVKAGEDVGDKLGRGIIKGLGNFFLGGPGLILGALGIGKLFGQLAKFSTDAFKSITGLNAGQKQREDVQARINALLLDDKSLMDQITNGTLTAAQAADKVLASYRSQEAVLKRINSQTKGAAGLLGGTGIAGGKTTASGFMPNFSGSAQERLAMLAAGYNPSDARTASVRKTRIYDGSGGSFSSLVNSKETVRTGTNASGYKATFVVPPKSSAAYGNYISNIPNFAGQKAFQDMLARASSSKSAIGTEAFFGKRTQSSRFNNLFREISGGAGGFNKGQKRSVIEAFLRSEGGRATKANIRRGAASRRESTTNNLASALGGRGGNPLLIFSGERGSIKGELVGGGTAYEVGLPINKALLNQGMMASYPNFVERSLANPNIFDKDLPNQFVKNIKARVKGAAPDPQGLGQIYGAVLQTITSGFGSSAQFGNERYDFARGGKLDPMLAKYYNKKDPRVSELFGFGAELKGGEYTFENIFGKMAGEDKLSKSALIGVGGKGKRYAKAGGFFPNFSAKSRAMSTERALGGSPEFRMFPFPHVADRRTQKDFGDVMRDHPEGLGKAIQNSFQMQGVPNFANPLTKIGEFFGMEEDLSEVLFSSKADRNLKKLNFGMEKFAQSSDSIQKALSKATAKQAKYEEALDSLDPDQFAELLKDSSLPIKTVGPEGAKRVDKRSKAFRQLQMDAASNTAFMKSRQNFLKANKSGLQSLSGQREEAVAKQARGQNMRSKALGGAFLIPMLGSPLIEQFTDSGSPANVALNEMTANLGTAATVFSTVPGPVGAIAGGAVLAVTSLGTITNAATRVGEGLAENAEELKGNLQTLQDASSRYFDVASKLDKAISSGESGEIIGRLTNKLAETLSELDPAQQALLSSSRNLAEKQDEMAKVIDKKAQEVKQAELAAGIAQTINEGKGSGIMAGFRGVGAALVPGGRGFAEAANDFASITASNVGGFAQGIFGSIDQAGMRSAASTGGLSSGNFLGTLEKLGADSDLMTMLNTLNDESLDVLRRNIVRISKEADRNTKIARENVKVQQQYNALIAAATRAQQEAADNLVHIQKTLVDNFVFNREMQSDTIFNQIDTNIAKFDALFGAAAQNLNAFEKADINFRQKRLQAEINFQKQITKNQNDFIRTASDLASVSTGILQSPTSKKAATRRGSLQTEISKEFTEALRNFDATQNMEQFTSDIGFILEGQGDASQKNQRKLEIAANKQNQLNAKLLEEQEKQVEIAAEIRDIEKSQADLLKGGGVKSILDPASFDNLRGSLVDSMEDVFRGRGGGLGAAGVNDLQAGSGFLNIIQSLRDQGFDTSALATGNAGLRQQAINARQQQNFAIADDLRTLGQAVGDPSLTALASQLTDPSLAGKQIDDFLDPGKAAREQQEAIQALITAQGDTFKTGTDEIRDILSRNVDDQSETFGRLDEASKELDEAAASLYRIEQLRLTDDTAARLAAEGARLGKEESVSLAAQGARAVAQQFGAKSAAGFAGQIAPLGFGNILANYNSSAAELNKLLGGESGGFGVDAFLKKGGLAGFEGINALNFESAFGNEEFINAIARALVKTGGSIGDLARGKTMPEQFARVLAQELQAAGLATGAAEGRLGDLLGQTLFSDDPNSVGNRVNAIKQLQDMAANDDANAREIIKNLTESLKFARQEEFSNKEVQNLLQKRDEVEMDLRESERQNNLNTSDNLRGIRSSAASSMMQSGAIKSMDDAFKVNENIFTEAKKSITTPFVAAIDKLKDSPIKVEMGEQVVNLQGGEELRDAVSQAAMAGAQASVNKALGEMANVFTSFTKMIDMAKEGLPTNVRQKIDTYQAVGSNILANQRAFEEAKKRGFK
tara:strand:+ start:6030 stop:12737 length:6708 start_codon:yes stop_codon:yes gene_type:complete